MTTTSWRVGLNGNWDQAGLWSGGVPDASTDAMIDAPGSYTVTLSSVAAAGTLGLNSSLAIFDETAAGSLTTDTLSITAGTAILDGANSIAVLNVLGGILELGNKHAIAAATTEFFGGEIVSTVSQTITNPITQSGVTAFAAATGKTLTVHASDFTFGSDGGVAALEFGDTLGNDGTVIWKFGTPHFDETFLIVDVLPGATLTAGDGDFSGLTHNGAQTKVDGTLDLGGFDTTIDLLGGEGTVTSSGGASAAHLSLESGIFYGAIAGNIELDVPSGGNLVLVGQNTYTGNTDIEGGALTLFNGASIKGLIQNDGTLTVEATSGMAATLLNTVQGDGELDIEGPGAVTMNRTNFYHGGTDVSGVLNLGRAAAIGDGLLTLDSGVLTASKSMTIGNDLTWTTGTIAAAHGTTLKIDPTNLVVNNAPGELIQIGSPTADGTVILALSGNLIDNGSCQFVVAGGTVKSEDATLANIVNTAESVLVAQSATLDFNSGLAATRDLQGTGTVAVNGALQLIGGSFAGVIEGGGTVSVFNPAILTGANTYTGGTTIEANSTLALGGGGTHGSVKGAIDDKSMLIVDRSNTDNLTNVISDVGSVAFIGSGTVVIHHANTYDGATEIASGIVSIDRAAALGDGNGVVTVEMGGELLADDNFSFGNRINFLSTATLAAATGKTLNIHNASVLIDADTFVFGDAAHAGTIVWGPAFPETDTKVGTVDIHAGTLMSAAGGDALNELLHDATQVKVDSGATLDLANFDGQITNLHGAGIIQGEHAGAQAVIFGGNFAGQINGALFVAIEDDTILSGGGNFSGGLAIDGGHRLDLSGAAQENVDLENAATVALHAPDQFTGHIQDFGGTAAIDLTGIDFGGGTTRSYNKSTHTLTVTDGAHTAHVVFDGSYAKGNFVLADDGAGGTDVTFAAVPHAPDWPFGG